MRIGAVTGLLLVVLLQAPGPTVTPNRDAESAEIDGLADVQALVETGQYAAAEEQGGRLLIEVEARYGAASLEAAAVLNSLVPALARNGKANEPDTLELAGRALSLHEQLAGGDDPRLVTSLSNLALCFTSSARVKEARPVRERILAIVERQSPADPKEIARARGNLANVLSRLDLASEARPLYEAALEILSEMPAPPALEMAHISNNLGLVLRTLGDRIGAEEAFVDAIALWETIDADHPMAASPLLSLGLIRGDNGDYAAALQLYERALEIQERRLGSDHPKLAWTLNALGVVLRRMGDYRASRGYYERALDIRKRKLAPGSFPIAVSYHNLGVLHRSLGDYEAARRMFETALEAKIEAVGEDRNTVASTMNSLAATLRKLGDIDAAIAYHENAARILEKIDAGESLEMSRSLEGLSHCLRDRREFAEAGTLSRQTLEIRRRIEGESHPLVALSRVRLGDQLTAAGDPRAALAEIELGLDLMEETVGAEHFWSAFARRALARAHLARGENGAALDQGLAAAGIARLLLRQTGSSLAEREALLLQASLADGRSLALSALERGGSELNESDGRRAWSEVIRSRALIFDEMALRHRASRDGRGATAAAARALDEARASLARLAVKGPDNVGLEVYKKAVELETGRKEGAERDLAATHAAAGTILDRREYNVDDVLGALPDGSVLIGYSRYRNAYMAFVATQDTATVETHPLGSAKEIEALIADWRRELVAPPRGPGLSGGAAEESYRAVASRLRRRIWDPIAQYTVAARMVFVVPDGALNLVSLAALPADDETYLIETAPPLHYISAEADLVSADTEGPTGNVLLALGGADFGETSPVSGPGPLAEGCGGLRGLGFDPIPGSKAEVEEIARAWRMRTSPHEDSAVRVLVGTDANESKLRRLAPHADVLHLATHGFYVEDDCAVHPDSGLAGETPPESPADILGESPLLLSGVALAGANSAGDIGEPADADGILTAEEIVALDLSRVDWVVLSGCETGVGRIVPGEGVLGLRRALKLAGASTLIMSLWPVDDQAVAKWMQHLYQARFDGLSTANAVRTASRKALEERRTTGRTTHPFYWAAFVGVGGWK